MVQTAKIALVLVQIQRGKVDPVALSAFNFLLHYIGAVVNEKQHGGGDGNSRTQWRGQPRSGRLDTEHVVFVTYELLFQVRHVFFPVGSDQFHLDKVRADIEQVGGATNTQIHGWSLYLCVVDERKTPQTLVVAKVGVVARKQLIEKRRPELHCVGQHDPPVKSVVLL